MRTPILAMIFLSGLPIAGGAAQGADAPAPPWRTEAAAACQSNESWRFSRAIRMEARLEFLQLISGKISPARALSDALSYRRMATSQEAVSFGEYWISRALLAAQLQHAAYNGFTYIAAVKPTPKTAGVQLAAIDCVSRINERFPSLDLSPGILARLNEYPKGQVTWDFAARMFRQELNEKRPESEMQATLAYLRGSGMQENFAQGLWAERRGDFKRAISELSRVVWSVATGNRVANPMKRYEDESRLLLARALYSTGQFDKALAQLRAIQKSSNELAETLSELSWAALMQQKYSDSVGAVISLQAGGLRHTFAPEGPMVMSMALNELCQYPEALKAIDTFRGSYEPAYRWLSFWHAHQRMMQPQLYALAVEFLEHKKLKVPERVGTEWIRSPLFIAGQDEMNLLVDEDSSASAMSHRGSKEEKALGRDILARARDIRSRMRDERGKLKTYVPGTEWMSPELRADMAALRKEVGTYRSYRRAGLVWRGMLASQRSMSPARKRTLVARIDSDLASRNFRMLAMLGEIAENNQLIEVEIYNGASQDIIWQNAHPDYKALAQRLREENRQIASGKTWDWGHHPASDEHWTEIWEDELGSFKANINDNCSSPDKYLAIKRGENRKRRGA